jgi:hypothetical protein
MPDGQRRFCTVWQEIRYESAAISGLSISGFLVDMYSLTEHHSSAYETVLGELGTLALSNSRSFRLIERYL